MINLKTKRMNKLPVIIAFVFTACTGSMQQDSDTRQTQTQKEKENVTALQLNNGAKWKLDDATKKNIAALKQIINDTTVASQDMVPAMQSGLDTLVSQCTMKGPDHDALHQWLELFMHMVKELKEDDEKERQEAIITIRKELENFDKYFE
jgi:hypothetical protein